MNQYGTQFRYSPEKNLWDVIGVAHIGASGASTLLQWNGEKIPADQYTAAPDKGWMGFLSIDRTLTTGQYLITLQGGFRRATGLQVSFVSSTGIPAAPIFGIVTGTGDITAGTLCVQFSNLSGVATNPAEDEILIFCLTGENTPNP